MELQPAPGALALPLQQPGGGLELVAQPAEHVVDGEQALQAAVAIDDRRAADGPRAQGGDDGLDVVVLPAGDQVPAHDLADGRGRGRALGARQHAEHQVAIGHDADRRRQPARPRLDDDQVADVEARHAPRRLDHGLVGRGGDDVAHAQLAGSHAPGGLHGAFQRPRRARRRA